MSPQETPHPSAALADAPSDLRPKPSQRLKPSPLFPVTVFLSAGLVFLVQPMVAKLILPMLGGAAAVWNTSIAFFQIMLLLGYGYAHLLQKLKSLRYQVLVHGCLLILAAFCLPLGISSAFGDPPPNHPILWLLGVLSLSIGAPFAVLSATAPLVQSWFAASAPKDETGATPEPYGLYAASNLGSLLALLAYPVLIEPFSHLITQRLGWSIGYGVFGVLIITLGLRQYRLAKTVPAPPALARPPIRDMALWVLLAAAPSSLMIGVTTHLTTDVASAPFLWVVPLALYLITFIIAFQARPLISVSHTRLLQAVTVCACIDLIALTTGHLLLQVAVHLVTFFFAALLCHQALAQRRPDPQKLTVFYFCLSLGGVIGGSFNAFLAPVIFNSVIEYPLVLVLSCLAQPWGPSPFKLDLRQRIIFAIGAALSLIVILATLAIDGLSTEAYPFIIKALIIIPIACAFMLRERAVYFALLLGLSAVAGLSVTQRGQVIDKERSFFGVVKIYQAVDPTLGPIRMMAHGTTLHGLQILDPAKACTPVSYYAPVTAIGQTLTTLQARSDHLDMGVVGLGTGIIATYVRPMDHLKYYEIDPLVVKDATNPHWFTYLSHCAKSKVDIAVGDARIRLRDEPDNRYDFLMIDAFSSDAIPAHLLTVEAVKIYLSKLRPGGVVAFHLSNRHLELRDPVMAAVHEADGYALTQTYLKPAHKGLALSSTVVVIAGHNEASLADFRADPRWVHHRSSKVKAWTDDYTNLIGAMIANRNH